MKNIYFAILSLLLLFSLYLLPLPTHAVPPVADPTISKHGGIVPDCNPLLPPGTPYDKNEKDPEKIPCGVNKFVELLQGMIDYLKLAVIPIAVLMVGWGGFQILTSAGSEEKFGAGKKAIITACIGIVIILVSYLVIKFVFQALGVSTEFTGSLFK